MRARLLAGVLAGGMTALACSRGDPGAASSGTRASDAGAPEAKAAPGERFVEVDLTDQRLRAFEGKRIALDVRVSTGPGDMTPTGVFRIWKKHVAKDMKVELKILEKVYYVPNVPYVMYYFNEEIPRTRGFAIHGAYWHKDYGNPVSHGCVNMAIEDAKKLFYWTSPGLRGADHAVESEDNPGTRLVVYGDAPKGGAP